MATTNIQTFAGQVEVNSNLTVNTNTLHVDSVAGRVGIGKTDPAYAMDVNGTVNATALYVDGSEFSGSPWTESGSNIYYTTGAVGIGTTDPQKTLEVAGPMRITDGGTNVCDLSAGDGSWGFQQKITAPDSGPNDQFGYSVSISSDGSYAIAGARYYDRPSRPANENSGSAYIFSRSGTSWTYQSTLTAPDRATRDYFGHSVAISGDGSYAIAGAAGDDAVGPETGSAYIFSRSETTWTFQQKITDPGSAPAGRLGFSVSISGDGSYAIAGAWSDNVSGRPNNCGSAYIFSRSGTSWTVQQKINAPDGLTQDRFGWSVSISGDGSRALVGAQWDDVTYTDQGSAYIFSRSGTSWGFQQKITAPDPANYDYFSQSVAISGDGAYAIVGAYRGDETYSDQGSAYIYNLPAPLNVSTPITADGTLLSFTGQHICFPEGPMGQGLVVSANKNKYVSLNGSLTTGTSAIKSSEALPVVSLSNVANDRSVFGVVDHFEQSGTTRSQTSGATVIKQDKESGDNRVIVNSLGEGAIWVANTNGNVVSGDFLTTSHLPGYAQRQSDNDTLLNYTVAKSTMDCDFEPEDLPVQVILKDDDGNNVLDSHGRLQWVDSDRTEPEYRIRYLDVSGTPTDEANAVHKAAYVGCTYHCG